MGRGGGKTHLAARLAAEAVAPDGALAMPGTQTVVVASSHSQARIALGDVLTLLGDPSRPDWKVNDNSSRADLTHLATGLQLRCISSDHRRAHGLRPRLVLADEPAQWGPSADALWAAIYTALGKVPGARVLLVGTRPASPDHFMARLLTQAATEQTVVAHSYSATDDDPPGQWSTWVKANPGLRSRPPFPDPQALAAQSRLAQKSPSELASFRALRLNMGTADVDPGEAVLPADAWASAMDPDQAGEPIGPTWWGLDLGGARSLSAVACYWPQTGRVEVISAVGGTPDLVRRGTDDGVGDLYVTAAMTGELIVAGGRLPDVDHLLTQAADRWGGWPSGMASDRFRAAETQELLARIGPIPVAWRGRGWEQASEDLGRFRAAVLGGQVHGIRSRLLDHALARATVDVGQAGDRRINSSRTSKYGPRDDPLAATILAISLGEQARIAGQKGPSIWVGEPIGPTTRH